MRIQFSPPRARIVAVVLGVWMLYGLLTRHVRFGVFEMRLPPLEPVHVIAGLAIICIMIVGLARLFRDSR